jgi:hypothetical protein
MPAQVAEAEEVEWKLLLFGLRSGSPQCGFRACIGLKISWGQRKKLGFWA